MQLTRDEAAFLSHGGLALQGCGTQALDGTRQVAGNGFQQGTVVFGQGPGFAVKQVELANHPLVQPDGHADDGLEAFSGAVSKARRGAVRQDRDHPCRGAALGLTAQAVARGNAQLFVDHRLRQAVGRQQQVLAVGLVRPAHGRGISAGDLAHLSGDALRQRLQRLGTRHERGRLVQGRQARSLGLEMLGLFLHLGL